MDVQTRNKMRYPRRHCKLGNLMAMTVGKGMEKWTLIYTASVSVGGYQLPGAHSVTPTFSLSLPFSVYFLLIDK